MKYRNAESVFPSELLTEMQKYVQDGIIYIPKAENNKKRWGENTKSKDITLSRNNEIKSAYRKGATVDELSEKYFLSLESIKKIVYCKK